MTPYSAGDRLILTDARGVPLGTVVLDGSEGARVLGTFRPEPAFETVAVLFRRFEDHVDAAALAVLPDIEREIAALGLRVGRTGESTVRAEEVQIYSDGGFSCRAPVPLDEPPERPLRPALTTH